MPPLTTQEGETLDPEMVEEWNQLNNLIGDGTDGVTESTDPYEALVNNLEDDTTTDEAETTTTEQVSTEAILNPEQNHAEKPRSSYEGQTKRTRKYVLMRFLSHLLKI